MFFLIKLLLLPIWLPFKIIEEIIEHSGRRRRYRRRRRARLNWAPGRAGLSRWASSIMAAAQGVDRTPIQRFVVTPLAALTVCVAWVLLVTVWVCWWMLLVIVLAVELFV